MQNNINKILVSVDDFEEIDACSNITVDRVFFYNKLLTEWKKKHSDVIEEYPDLWIYTFYDTIFNAGYLQAMRETKGQSNER